MKKTFINTGLGVSECVNSRMSRRVTHQGEMFAMERELPQVFELMLEVLQKGCESYTHFEMRKVLHQELEAKEHAGIKLSSKTKDLLELLRQANTLH